ncbi:hypothetical protein [Saccharolobus caldissimus]|uniref:hypothetical protein n=1 Tax=Saccharolobus caldissimus TaxID=1702097 RepID=UPI001E58EB8E|nr:hypothetical protein [Saccharolobus caldissimus]
MDRLKILEEIYKIKGELIRTFGRIRNELLGIKDTKQLALLPAWIKSRIKDENGSVEITEDGYGNRILIIKLEDPWTEDKNKNQRKTAFVIYFSFQTSKPIVPAQLPWKLNQIYSVVKKLREKGYHVYPAIAAYAFTPGAKDILKKHKVEFFNSLEDLLNWIYSKLLYRLQKLVEATKFTFKFDKIFLFLKKIIEGLGFEISGQILEAWAYKPKYPNQQ